MWSACGDSGRRPDVAPAGPAVSGSLGHGVPAGPDGRGARYPVCRVLQSPAAARSRGMVHRRGSGSQCPRRLVERWSATGCDVGCVTPSGTSSICCRQTSSWSWSATPPAADMTYAELVAALTRVLRALQVAGGTTQARRPAERGIAAVTAAAPSRRSSHHVGPRSASEAVGTAGSRGRAVATRTASPVSPPAAALAEDGRADSHRDGVPIPRRSDRVASRRAGGRESLLARALLLAIRWYQRWVSPLLGAHCRFAPSCSAYAAEAVGSTAGREVASWPPAGSRGAIRSTQAAMTPCRRAPVATRTPQRVRGPMTRQEPRRAELAVPGRRVDHRRDPWRAESHLRVRQRLVVGLAIVLLTVVIRILLFPLFVKQIKAQRTCSRSQPQDEGAAAEVQGRPGEAQHRRR